MRIPVTLLAIVAGLVALFGVAINLGESIVGSATPSHRNGEQPRNGEQRSAGDDDHGKGPGGLAVASQGYVLRPRATRFIAGDSTDYVFNVFTLNGKPVIDFVNRDGRRMNLVIVRRDMSGYQHLYPVMAPDGTWSVPLQLHEPGSYRAFAEFLPGAAEAPVTLGVDLEVPGLVEPGPITKVSTVDEADGFTVIWTGDLIAGSVSRMWMHVMRDDVPVTDLDLYQGNAGRLVILREGDLAYLQVRPVAGPSRETTITFDAEAPTAGYYRMFLEFQHHGQVRIAEFTVQAR
jgi:hypothetical protein